MPVASLEILDCGFESRELALQAGDCLIQPRFCAFDIEGGLTVFGFRHGSRHVDYAAAPSPGPIRNSSDIRYGEYRVRPLVFLTWACNIRAVAYQFPECSES